MKVWRPAGPKVIDFGGMIVTIELGQYWEISPAGCPIFEIQTRTNDDPRKRGIDEWIGWVFDAREAENDIEILVDASFDGMFFSYGWRRATSDDVGAHPRAMILREVVPVAPWTYGDNRATLSNDDGTFTNGKDN